MTEREFDRRAKPYFGLLRHIALRAARGQVEDAEDLVSYALFNAWQHREQFRDETPRSFRLFLTFRLRTEIYRWHNRRKAAFRPRAYVALDVCNEEGDRMLHQEALSVLMAQEQERAKQIATTQDIRLQLTQAPLSPQERRIVALLCEGLTQSDIAREMGTSRQRIAQQMKIIRRCLDVTPIERVKSSATGLTAEQLFDLGSSAAVYVAPLR